MVLLIIIPIKWLFHWEYTLFSDKPTFLSFLNSALGSAEACANPNGHTEARPVLRCNAKVKLGSQRVPKGPKSPKPCEPLQAFRRHYLQSDCGTNQAFQAEGMLAMQVAESNKPRYSASWPQWGMTSRYSASQWTNDSHTTIGTPQTQKNISQQVVDEIYLVLPGFQLWYPDLGGCKTSLQCTNISEVFHHTATCLSYHCVIAIELLGLLQPPAVLCHNHRSHFRLAWKFMPVQNPETSQTKLMFLSSDHFWSLLITSDHFWSLLISSDPFCSVQPRHWDPICRAVHTVAEQRPISQLPHRLSCRIRETEHSQPLLRLKPIRPPPRISPTSWPPRPKAYNAKDADLVPAVCFSVNYERQHNLYIYVIIT